MALVPHCLFAIISSLRDYAVCRRQREKGVVTGSGSYWSLVTFVLLNLLQLRIPILGTVSRLAAQQEMQEAVRWLKRLEMIVIGLPLGILHFGVGLTQNAESQATELEMQFAIVLLAVLSVVVTGVQMESFRFWHDPGHRQMRPLEILTTVLFRFAEVNTPSPPLPPFVLSGHAASLTPY